MKQMKMMMQQMHPYKPNKRAFKSFQGASLILVGLKYLEALQGLKMACNRILQDSALNPLKQGTRCTIDDAADAPLQVHAGMHIYTHYRCYRISQKSQMQEKPCSRYRHYKQLKTK